MQGPGEDGIGRGHANLNPYLKPDSRTLPLETVPAWEKKPDAHIHSKGSEGTGNKLYAALEHKGPTLTLPPPETVL